MVKVSVVIPAHNEEENIPILLKELMSALEADEATRDFEVVIVNDNSKDGTGALIDGYSASDARIKAVHRKDTPGFGNAVRTGFKNASGSIIIPVMADLSDNPKDIPAMVRKLEEGYDVAYGSRFCKGGYTDGYPWKKMVANRTFNNMVRLMFGIRHRDITNAFKAYRREVLDAIGLDNLEANGFDLTAEIPLKAHVLGFSSVEVPVSWHEREHGEAKLKLSQNGLKYGRRLLKLFVMGNLVSIGDIFRAVVKGSWVHIIVAMLIGVILLFSIFSLAGFSEIFGLLSNISPLYVIAACAAILSTFILRTWRWSVLLRSSGYRVHVDNAFKCIMFGWLMNYVLPARVGDFARGFTLKTTEGTPFSVGLSTIVIERAMDMLTMALILIAAIMLIAGISDLWYIALLAGIVAVLLIFVLFIVYKFDAKIFDRPGSRLVSLRGSVDAFKKSIKNMSANPQAIALCMLISVPVWLFEVASLYFSAKAIGIDVSMAMSIIAGIVAFIAQAIPTTPAGIGIHEGTIAGVLMFFGIPASAGTSIALVDHFARGVIIFILGMISLVHIGFESRRYFAGQKKSTPEAKDEDRAN